MTAWPPRRISSDMGGIRSAHGTGGKTVAPVELLDAPGRVDELLLAGEERVALGADLQPQLLASGPGDEGLAAGADDGQLLVVRVDLRFHRFLRKGGYSRRFSDSAATPPVLRTPRSWR